VGSYVIFNYGGIYTGLGRRQIVWRFTCHLLYCTIYGCKQQEW